MTGYPFKPRALAWDSRSTMLATGGDAKVTVWRFDGKGPEGTRPIVLDAHRAQVTCLAFAPKKAMLASAGHDTGVIIWRPRESRAPLAYALAEDRVEAIAFRPDGARLAAIDASGRVFVWESPRE